MTKWYEGQEYEGVLTAEHLIKARDQILIRPELKISYVEGLGSTQLPSFHEAEPCQSGYEVDDGSKRDRTTGNQGKRARAKLKNRKAAKAARKARKK